MQIAPLAQHRPLWPQVAALMQSTWPDWYGSGGQGDALADIHARAAPGLPQGLVALAEGQLHGIAALDRVSYGARGDEGPWVVGLATDPRWRRQGVASALVANCESQAEGPLFTTTISAFGLFARRGWTHLRDTEDGWHVLRFAP